MPDLNGVNPQLGGAVQALINASGGQIYITSGYRDAQLQTKLYNQAVAKYGAAQAGNWVAPPGHSNHEKGLAVDLGGNMTLLHKLAPQFGLSFPMSWEPWHVELPSTRGAATPSAYTPSPFGDPNPTQDPSIAQHPDHVMATGVEAAKNALASAEAGPLGGGANPLGGSEPLSGDTGAGHLPSAGVPASAPQSGGGGGGGGGGNASQFANVTTGGTRIAPGDLYKKLLAEGLDPAHAAAGVAIAGRESGYNAAAFNGNANTGDLSYGLFQINKLGGMHSQYSTASLQTVDGSAAAYADMVKHGGLTPWGGYKGMPWHYNTNLEAAAAASGGQVSVAQLEALQ